MIVFSDIKGIWEKSFFFFTGS